MLAQRIPTVLPPLHFDEALKVTRIYSVAGLLDGHGLMMRRPFRAPHHTISQIALIGGDTFPRPGEVSLAHRAFCSWTNCLNIKKSLWKCCASRSVTFPADCMLVAAMTPCPCGFLSDPRRTCTCSPQQIERYRAKLSGPLLDRIDLHVEVPAVPFDDLRSRKPGADSATMRARIAAARELQAVRYAGTACRTNAELSGSLPEEHCRLGTEEHEFLREAVQALALSARAYIRILRISRTIADLDKAETLNVSHLAEAVNCRVLDRQRLG